MREITKRKITTLITSLAVALMFSLSTMTVHATAADVNSIANQYSPAATGESAWPGALAGYFTTQEPGINAAGEFGAVAVGNTTYWYRTDNTKNIIAAAQGIKAIGDTAANDAASIENFEDITGGMGVQADIGSARDSLQPFVPIVNLLLGIIVVLVGMFTTVSTGLDIAYIQFPVFRGSCDTAKANGGGMIGTRGQSSSGDGSGKLRLVSDEAVHAIQSTNTIETGKNPLFVYLKKRAVGYIMLAIVMFIFLTGRITIFTSAALRLLDGVLGLLQGTGL